MGAKLLLLLTLCPMFANSALAQNVSFPSMSPDIRESHKPLHDKDNISLIGHRNLGHTGFGNWYSLDSEIALGKEYSALVEAHLKLLDDPLVTEYVNRIGQIVVSCSDAKVPFTIKVVDSDELNAFTLPGGFLYVNHGVILIADNEAELAGVMAHEIAHVAARHATRQMTRANMLSLVSLPLDMAGGGLIGQAVQLAVGFMKPVEMLKFSRSFESEADYLGLEYLYAAGYDPEAFISFLERASAEENDVGKWGALLSTHPLMTSRIKKSQLEIARVLPQRDSYIVNTSQFDEVKAHLRALAGPQSSETQQKTHEPVFRSRLPGSGSTRK